jgi:hypothetical protein
VVEIYKARDIAFDIGLSVLTDGLLSKERL